MMENWRFDMILLFLKWFCFIENLIEWQNSRKTYKKQTLTLSLLLFSDKNILVNTTDENLTVSDLKKILVCDIYFRTKYQKLYHKNTKGDQKEVCGGTKIKDLLTQNNTIPSLDVSKYKLGLNMFELLITAKVEYSKFAKAKTKKDCNELYCFCMTHKTGKKCPKGFEQ